jgi:hypothetical protein
MNFQSKPSLERKIPWKIFGCFASTLQPCEEILPYKVEVNFRPSIPDNLEHWQVFDDEKKILCFLQNEGEFSETQINLLNEEGDIKVIDFPDDSFPRILAPLERMFDQNDLYKGKMTDGKKMRL